MYFFLIQLLYYAFHIYHLCADLLNIIFHVPVFIFLVGVITTIAIFLAASLLVLAYIPHYTQHGLFVSVYFWQAIATIVIVFLFLILLAFEGARTNLETTHFLYVMYLV